MAASPGQFIALQVLMCSKRQFRDNVMFPILAMTKLTLLFRFKCSMVELVAGLTEVSVASEHGRVAGYVHTVMVGPWRRVVRVALTLFTVSLCRISTVSSCTY